MHRLFAATLLAATLGNTALAAEVSPQADKVLWCSSAFFWLGSNASDSGDEIEAEQYQAWSTDLMAEGVALLKASGMDDAAIQTLQDDYDNAVVAELGTPKARYDVTTCPELIETK